jgi:signal transduction histidine kinase
LLTLSRAGRAEYRPERVDLNVLVHRTAARYQPKLEAVDARLVAHPLPSVEADPDALEQVLTGLIDHAIDSLEPGRAPRIEIGARELEDHRERAGQQPAQPFVTLYVADNGRGIPASQMTRVFAAFYRPQGGDGVALALVRRIVERHGGRMWVESVEGSGSTFYLTLPAVPATPAAPSATAEAAA